jgi:hypothetical protein
MTRKQNAIRSSAPDNVLGSGKCPISGSVTVSVQVTNPNTIILTFKPFSTNFHQSGEVKRSHSPQKDRGWRVVGIRHFNVIHKAVDCTTERILHGQRAVKMPAMDNRRHWGEYRMHCVGPH